MIKDGFSMFKLTKQVYIIGGIVVCLVVVLLLLLLDTKPEVINKQVRIDSIKQFESPIMKDNNTITIELNTFTLLYEYIDYLPLLMVSIVVLVGIMVTGRNNVFVIILLTLPIILVFFKGINLFIAIVCLVAMPFVYINIKAYYR